MNFKDNAYHFRQDSTFLYYFGIQRPGLVAVIDTDNDSEILFGNEFTVEDTVWMGQQTTIEEQASLCGVSQIQPTHQLEEVLGDAKITKRQIHFLPPYRSENKVKLQNLIGITPSEVATKFSIALVKAVISQREIKTEEEIIEISNAVDLTVDMHLAGIRCAKAGMSEAEVVAEVHKVALDAAGGLSFPIIATIDGQILHNHYHGNKLKEGDLFLLDAGFENQMCYAGDLSSTFPVSKTFSAEQKEIYQLSLGAHQAAINTLASGIPFKEAHHAACTAIFDGLKGMGLTKGDTADAIVNGAHALFFQCGTGHMMGLDVHDMEDLGEIWVGYEGQAKSTQFGLKSLRLAKPLEVGHVVTIEPGIYFIPELIDQWRAENKFEDFINWDKVNAFRNFGGIRNEEDFVVTENGAQRLGKPKPKTIAEIEEIRSF